MSCALLVVFMLYRRPVGCCSPELPTNLADTRNQLTKFSDMQNTKADIDAATVFLVLIPASKLSGDSAADVGGS